MGRILDTFAFEVVVTRNVLYFNLLNHLQTITELPRLTSFTQLFRNPEVANAIIYDFVCPAPGGQVPQVIENGLNNLRLPPDFNNPVCDNEFLNDALMQARIMIRTFYNLTTHAQFCRCNTNHSNVSQLFCSIANRLLEFIEKLSKIEKTTAKRAKLA